MERREERRAVIQELEPWGPATGKIQLPLETTAEKWINSTVKQKRGRRRGSVKSEKKKQTEQMFRGGLMVRGQRLYHGGGERLSPLG